ncbi:hypothetical protein HPB52_019234 [Rhipicephalus sanguineus]|uniref:Uncharacterized protein n=1 Tax=Rhipicephalus sanguineus TaxID=34632 RepID=A0A9D4PG69_RHISA|nr:hypothetical protein HPB52_019234 [Rhipicephalus sanguineus]
MLDGNDDADGEDTEDCENLLVEVLERQGAADEEVNFSTFRDVDSDELNEVTAENRELREMNSALLDGVPLAMQPPAKE